MAQQAHACGRFLSESTSLQLFGQDEWDAQRQGRARRQWRKLPLGANAATGEIAAHRLAESDTDDADQAPDLLRVVEGSVVSLTANGAYDSNVVYQP